MTPFEDAENTYASAFVTIAGVVMVFVFGWILYTFFVGLLSAVVFFVMCVVIIRRSNKNKRAKKNLDK